MEVYLLESEAQLDHRAQYDCAPPRHIKGPVEGLIQHLYIPNQGILSSVASVYWGLGYTFNDNPRDLALFARAVITDGTLTTPRVTRRVDMPDEQIRTILEAGKRIKEATQAVQRVLPPLADLVKV